MRNLNKVLFLICIIIFSIISCEKDENPCGGNPFQIYPSTPYDNPVWHPSIIFSFVKQFEKSTLYYGNGAPPQGGRFSQIPEELNGS